MPRFFFHVHDGPAHYEDCDGADMPNIEGAREAALELVSDLIRDTEALWRGGAFRVIAEDEHHARLFSVEVMARALLS
jgi:hypothetical protein